MLVENLSASIPKDYIMKLVDLFNARKAEKEEGLQCFDEGSYEFDIIFEVGSSFIISQRHRKGGNCYAEIEITVEGGEYWDHVTEKITTIPDSLVGVWYAEDVIMDYGESLTAGHLTHLRKRPTEITLGMLTKAPEEELRELFKAYSLEHGSEATFEGFLLFAKLLGEI